MAGQSTGTLTAPRPSIARRTSIERRRRSRWWASSELDDALEGLQRRSVKAEPQPQLLIAIRRGAQHLDHPHRAFDRLGITRCATRAEQPAAGGAEPRRLLRQAPLAAHTIVQLWRVAKPIHHAAGEPDNRGARVALGVGARRQCACDQRIDLGVGVMTLEHTVGQLRAQRCAGGSARVAPQWRGGNGFRLCQHVELTAPAGELHAASGEEVGARREPALTLAHASSDDTNLAVLERQHGKDAV